LNWIKAINKITEGEAALDGKTLQHSYDEGATRGNHMVSAWATQNRLVLGQVKVDENQMGITRLELAV